MSSGIEHLSGGMIYKIKHRGIGESRSGNIPGGTKIFGKKYTDISSHKQNRISLLIDNQGIDGNIG